MKRTMPTELTQILAISPLPSLSPAFSVCSDGIEASADADGVVSVEVEELIKITEDNVAAAIAVSDADSKLVEGILEAVAILEVLGRAGDTLKFLLVSSPSAPLS